MAKAKEEATKSLSERIKELSIISLNNTNYLGKSAKNAEKELVISDAIQIGSLNFEDAVKQWIRDENSNTLETFTVEGTNYALAKKGFNGDQLYKIDLVAATAAYNMSKVITQLENESF